MWPGARIQFLGRSRGCDELWRLFCLHLRL